MSSPIALEPHRQVRRNVTARGLFPVTQGERVHVSRNGGCAAQ
jgi:hypothetical protein